MRKRKEDIPALIAHFIKKNHRTGAERSPFSSDKETLAALNAHDWPGNVRELRNYLERSLILGTFRWDGSPTARTSAAAATADDDSLEAMERQHVLAVLAAARGNKSEAARRLGISRKTLERRCAEWQV